MNDQIENKIPKDNNGWTPIHHAAKQGHEQIIRLIFNCQQIENKNPQDNSGLTPMHIACKYSNEEIVKLFLNNNTITKDINNIVDNDGWTPMHYAFRQIKILLLFQDFFKSQKDPYHQENNYPKNKDGHTPWDLHNQWHRNLVRGEADDVFEDKK